MVHWVLVLAVRAGGEERGRAVAVVREGRWEKRMAVMMWVESRWCIADSGVGYVGVGFGFVAVRDLNEVKVNPTLYVDGIACRLLYRVRRMDENVCQIYQCLPTAACVMRPELCDGVNHKRIQVAEGQMASARHMYLFIFEDNIAVYR